MGAYLYVFGPEPLWLLVELEILLLHVQPVLDSTLHFPHPLFSLCLFEPGDEWEVSFGGSHV